MFEVSEVSVHIYNISNVYQQCVLYSN